MSKQRMRSIRKRVWTVADDVVPEMTKSPTNAALMEPPTPWLTPTSDSAPDGTLVTVHLRREHLVIVVALGLCLILWTRLCSVSARLALLESSSYPYKK